MAKRKTYSIRMPDGNDYEIPIFVAVFGITRYAEVLEAYNNGYAILCVMSSSNYRRVGTLYQYSGGQFTFRVYYQGLYYYYALLNSSGTWDGLYGSYGMLGNIDGNGDCTTNAVIEPGDRIMINDESASRIKNSSITFGDDPDQYLANDGTWQTVPAAGDANVQPDWNESDASSDAFIKNKPTIPTVPTKVSDLQNDSGFLTLADLPVWNGGVT